jgi:hypothetical protein
VSWTGRQRAVGPQRCAPGARGPDPASARLQGLITRRLHANISRKARTLGTRARENRKPARMNATRISTRDLLLRFRLRLGARTDDCLGSACALQRPRDLWGTPECAGSPTPWNSHCMGSPFPGREWFSIVVGQDPTPCNFTAPEGGFSDVRRAEKRLPPNPQHSSVAAAHGVRADRGSYSLRADLSAGAAGVPANLGRISRSDAFKNSAPIYSVTCAGARSGESVFCTPASCRWPPSGRVGSGSPERIPSPVTLESLPPVQVPRRWRFPPRLAYAGVASSGCRPSLTDARPSSQSEFAGTT